MESKKVKIDWFYLVLGTVIVYIGSSCRNNLESRFLTALTVLCYVIMASGVFLVILSLIPEKESGGSEKEEKV